MAQVFHFIKIAVAVIFGIAAAVCVFVAVPMVTPLAATSIAFSVMPELYVAKGNKPSGAKKDKASKKPKLSAKDKTPKYMKND